MRPTALLAGLMIACAAGAAHAADAGRSYAFSMYGPPGLPADFKAFPYVNPDAPKGGDVVLGSLGSFDSFNQFVLRGTPAGETARLYDSLLKESADETGVAYGHVAQSIEVAPDNLSVAYEIRPEAKFNDGQPITPDDVAWTFETLRTKGRPFYAQYYSNVADVAVDGPHRVVFHFKTPDSRELPLILGEFPILPKHWWASRDFSQPLSDAPLGSGPYRLDSYTMGRNTTLKRVPDYWAKDLPTGKGLANFDTIRTEYYRDATVALEAFKSGSIDFRNENISKNWATAYDFPAVDKGLVKKVEFHDKLPTGMQGFFMNTRRAVFADPRVREAMDDVFDFQWTNKNLFYGAYTRTESYYSNSDLASSGLPGEAELAVLDPYRSQLPASIFTTPFKLPVTDGSGNNREGLVHALGLLKQAGWTVKDRKLVDANGNQMSFAFLSDDPTTERVAAPYIQWLARLGIDARIRTVDPPQYVKLLDSFDFDMTMLVMGESDFPGNEQRDYWTCPSAKMEGSSNYAGVCSPVVDALVDKVIASKDRETLVANTRALDRVLLSGWYCVPNWHTEVVRAAFWNRFGYPAQPVRSGMVFDSWWVDPKLAAATDDARKMGN